jgi:hypothetical protein
LAWQALKLGTNGKFVMVKQLGFGRIANLTISQ